MATSPLRILCVDDDPDLLEIVRLSSKLSGKADVETALSAVEAIEKAPTFRPDLFLLDVMMPGIDGIELLKGLRDDPDWRETPVIYLTARQAPDDLELYLESGALGAIHKPFNPETLFEQISALLEDG